MNQNKNVCEINAGGVQQNKNFVINRRRWNSIVGHLHKNDEEKIVHEQEKRYNEYLREGSRAMTQNWDNSIQAIQVKKSEERWQKEQDELMEAEKKYKELIENDERCRNDKLSKAQDMMHRLKSGPRQLESATILSEVLKGREIQRKINEETRKKAREQHLQDGKEVIEQAHQWIEDHNKKLNASKKRTGEYKSEMLENNKEESRRKLEKARKQADAERLLRETADREMKEQIERERGILERKKEAMRRNALEAMKMAEQRRKRDLETEKVEDKLIELYTKEKNSLDKLRKQKAKEEAERAEHKKAELTNMVFKDYAEQTPEEKEMLQKDAERLQAKMKDKEREKLEFEKKMKAARIEAHLKEVEKSKQLKADRIEESRWEIANRLKNAEIQRAYDSERKKYKLKVLNENRSILLQQMDERVKKSKEEKSLNDLEFLRAENERDDKQFFAYAEELIADAKKKGRPILPIQKVVDTYKERNRLCEQRGDPSHLKSSIPINRKCECKPQESEIKIKYDISELNKMNPATPRPATKENKTDHAANQWRCPN